MALYREFLKIMWSLRAESELQMVLTRDELNMLYDLVFSNLSILKNENKEYALRFNDLATKILRAKEKYEKQGK